MLNSVLRYKLQRERGLAVPELNLRLYEFGDSRFRAESNLSSCGLDRVTEHKVIERALLGLGGFGQRIEDMAVHNALSGFLDAECPRDCRNRAFEQRRPDTADFRTCTGPVPGRRRRFGPGRWPRAAGG